MSDHERPWLKSYPEGVPAEIDMGRYASINDLFEQSCRDYSDLPAFSNLGVRLSFSELDRLSRDCGAWLQNGLGLKKGDRVALMMPNVLQYPVALFGALRAGLVVVNVNPLYTPRELSHQLEDSGAAAIIVLANFAHTLAACREKLHHLRHIVITEVGDLLGFPKRPIVNFVVKRVKRMVPAYSLSGALDFLDGLSDGARMPLDAPPIAHDDLAFLQYTGGTTGIAKGAMLTHGNLVANMLQASAWISRDLRQGQEVIITALPLYHIFALTANCLVFMSIGGHNVLITNPRDMKAFLKDLEKTPFTAITGVNTLFNALLNQERFRALDFSGLRLALGGGMAVQRPVAERWKQVTGHTLVEAYGLTEASPAVCINPIDLAEYNGSIGLPIPSTDCSIRDEDAGTRELATGEVGELCVRGPQVMRGYWNRPDETQKVLSDDGWLRTGDMGRMDDNGFFYIVDRKKDMILVSGFNVYPNEIEDVAASHPGVLEAGAVGVESESSGEVVKLVVVRKDPSLTADALRDWLRGELTAYKVPKIIEFREELPKSNVGKILRRELR